MFPYGHLDHGRCPIHGKPGQHEGGLAGEYGVGTPQYPRRHNPQEALVVRQGHERGDRDVHANRHNPDFSDPVRAVFSDTVGDGRRRVVAVAA
jgi:hypothetical protein